MNAVLKNVSFSTIRSNSISLNDVTFKIIIGENNDILLGDVNGNNNVDIGDAVSIVNYLVGKPSTTFIEKAADTNKNGQIDIGDVVTIINYLMGTIERFD